MGESNSTGWDGRENWGVVLTVIAVIALVLSGVAILCLIQAVVEYQSSGYRASVSLVFLFTLLPIDLLMIPGRLFRTSKSRISIWFVLGPEIVGLIPIFIYLGCVSSFLVFFMPGDCAGAHISIFLSVLSLFVLLKDRKKSKAGAVKV